MVIISGSAAILGLLLATASSLISSVTTVAKEILDDAKILILNVIDGLSKHGFEYAFNIFIVFLFIDMFVMLSTGNFNTVTDLKDYFVRQVPITFDYYNSEFGINPFDITVPDSANTVQTVILTFFRYSLIVTWPVRIIGFFYVLYLLKVLHYVVIGTSIFYALSIIF